MSEIIRYTAMHPTTGQWMLTIYADRLVNETPDCTNYFLGDAIVAQVDPRQVTVGDSGGRLVETGSPT